MSRSSFLVNPNTPNIEQAILENYLEKANKFRAYFPGGEELGGSKNDFLALEGVLAQPWSGMEGSISVEGTLTPAARALIQERGQYLEDGCYHPLQLWSYELVNESEVLLRVEDFSVWIIFATLSELQSLEKKGISVEEWQEISLEPASDVLPLQMDQKDLEQLTKALEELF